jgi:hypothetical protein
MECFDKEPKNESKPQQIEVTMTTQDLYAKFEALEEEVAHCYFVLHEQFLFNSPLAKFWLDAALDEMQHASILRFCREHELFGQVDDAAAVIRKIDELLDVLRNTACKSKISVDAAFAAALIVESSELDEAYQKLTRPLAQTHLMLHEAIQSNLRLHHYNFAEAAEQFCRDKTYADAFTSLARTDRQLFTERTIQ